MQQAHSMVSYYLEEPAGLGMFFQMEFRRPGNPHAFKKESDSSILELVFIGMKLENHGIKITFRSFSRNIGY